MLSTLPWLPETLFRILTIVVCVCVVCAVCIYHARMCAESGPKEIFSDWAKQESGCERREPAADAVTAREGRWREGSEGGGELLHSSIHSSPAPLIDTDTRSLEQRQRASHPRSPAHAPTTASPATSATRHSNGGASSGGRRKWIGGAAGRCTGRWVGLRAIGSAADRSPFFSFSFSFSPLSLLRFPSLRQPLHRACPSLDLPSFPLSPTPTMGLCGSSENLSPEEQQRRKVRRNTDRTSARGRHRCWVGLASSRQ